MKKTLLSLFTLLITSNLALSQVNLAIEDFEDATVTYTLLDITGGEPGTSIAEDISDIAAEDYYGRVMLSDFEPGDGYLINNIEGSSFFGAGDVNGSPSLVGVDVTTMNWSGLNVAAISDVNIYAFFAEDADGADFDWDNDTSVRIEVQLDGGGYTTLFALEADEATGAFNQQAAVDTNFDGIGDGAVLTDTLTEYVVNVDVSSANTLDVRIVMAELGAGDEDIAIDNVRIIGDELLSIDDNEQIKLSYNNPVSNLLTIDNSKTTIAGIEIYSFTGAKVAQSKSNEVDMSQLQAGIYLAKVAFIENKRTTVVKVIKR